MEEQKQFTAREIVEKVGPVVAYEILSEMGDDSMTEKLVFSDWERIYREIKHGDDEKTKRICLDRMHKNARTFLEHMRIYIHEKDEDLADKAYARMLEVAMTEDWINFLNNSIMILPTTIEQKKSKLLWETAKNHIKKMIV